MQDQERFIQVGVTAMRNPATGEFLPAVPLYIKAEDRAEESEQHLISCLGGLLAHQIKAYMDGCKQAGVEI